MVVIVSGPISSSTYRTSEYEAFLVPVLAQSGRWTRAPRRLSAANGSPSNRLTEPAVDAFGVRDSRFFPAKTSASGRTDPLEQAIRDDVESTHEY